jgi:hypothetical protein
MDRCMYTNDASRSKCEGEYGPDSCALRIAEEFFANALVFKLLEWEICWQLTRSCSPPKRVPRRQGLVGENAPGMG